MIDRRRFLRGAAASAGASALAALAPARTAFARELERLGGGLAHGADLRWLAEEYMLSPDVLYFNHASIGTIPRAVHEARVRYLEACETNPWLYMWGDAWQAPREAVRAKAAQLLHCAADEVAITHNTTEGFNLLAQGLRLEAGDEVLYSSLNHPGASNAWTHQAGVRGFTVRRFDFPILDVPRMSAQDVVDAYVREISARTRVLVFAHIDNTVGLRYPVRLLADAARARGVTFIAVDGAQAVGMVPVDVRALGVDAYATSPHKWLQAPKGLGLLYVNAEVQERIHPMWVSSGQGRGRGTARVFEDYGTRNLAELLTLGDAIDFQARLGEVAKERRYEAMWQRFHRAAEEAAHLVWRSPADWSLSSSLYAIEVRGRRSDELFEEMYREHGAVFRAFRSQGLDTMRVSPNMVTTDEEIDRFLALVARAARA